MPALRGTHPVRIVVNPDFFNCITDMKIAYSKATLIIHQPGDLVRVQLLEVTQEHIDAHNRRCPNVDEKLTPGYYVVERHGGEFFLAAQYALASEGMKLLEAIRADVSQNRTALMSLPKEVETDNVAHIHPSNR